MIEHRAFLNLMVKRVCIPLEEFALFEVHFQKEEPDQLEGDLRKDVEIVFHPLNVIILILREKIALLTEWKKLI